jgi:hypothetical protein
MYCSNILKKTGCRILRESVLQIPPSLPPAPTSPHQRAQMHTSTLSAVMVRNEVVVCGSVVKLIRTLCLFRTAFYKFQHKRRRQCFQIWWYQRPYVHSAVPARGIPLSDLSNQGESAGWVLCNVNVWNDSGEETERPIKRWIKDVDEDVRMIIIRGRRVRTQERQDWSRTVREPEVHTGLQCHTWWWWWWWSFLPNFVFSAAIQNWSSCWYFAVTEGKAVTTIAMREES